MEQDFLVFRRIRGKILTLFTAQALTAFEKLDVPNSFERDFSCMRQLCQRTSIRHGKGLGTWHLTVGSESASPLNNVHILL